MKPILFSWGPITLYAYGLSLAVAFLFFLFYVRRAARVNGLDPETLTNTAFAALVGGIVGARALFVFLDWEFFLRHPVEIVLLNHGGLVWYGGFAGGVLAAALHARHSKIRVAEICDIFAPPLALAQAIGRIGCFLNGCCYGFETHAWYAACFPDGLGCRFPVQLLNAALLLALFVFLHRALLSARRPGSLIWLYGMGYGLLRFTTEFFRGDQAALALGLSLPQWISAAVALVSAAVFLMHRKQK